MEKCRWIDMGRLSSLDFFVAETNNTNNVKEDGFTLHHGNDAQVATHTGTGRAWCFTKRSAALEFKDGRPLSKRIL